MPPFGNLEFVVGMWLVAVAAVAERIPTPLSFWVADVMPIMTCADAARAFLFDHQSNIDKRSEVPGQDVDQHQTDLGG